MTIRINGNGRLQRTGTTGIPGRAGDFSLCFWFRQHTSTAGEYNGLVAVGGDNTNFNFDANTFAVYSRDGGANALEFDYWTGTGPTENDGETTYTNATWYHCFLTRSGNTWVFYRDNAQQNTGTFTPTNSSIDAFWFGAASGGGDVGRFDIAGVKWWDGVVLTADERANERSITPRRWANLTSWWPMTDTNITNAMRDFVSGFNFSTGGAAAPATTLLTWPPASWSAAPRLIIPVAAAATNDIAAAGSLSITGVADLDATGSLLAAGSLSITGVADLDAAGQLLAAGSLSITGSADLDALGQLAAVGSLSITGTADLDAIGQLFAAGSLTINGLADLDAIGNLLAAGSLSITGTADLTEPNASDIVASGTLTITGVAELTALGELSASGTVEITGIADLTGLGGQSPEETFSGGFFVSFEREIRRRERERRKREEEEAEAKAIRGELDRQIALEQRRLEAEAAEKAEIDRLRTLVARFADRQAEEAFTERVRLAFSRAAAQQNASALLALDREMRRMLEEEELAVLFALAMDD